MCGFLLLFCDNTALANDLSLLFVDSRFSCISVFTRLLRCRSFSSDCFLSARDSQKNVNADASASSSSISLSVLVSPDALLAFVRCRQTAL